MSFNSTSLVAVLSTVCVCVFMQFCFTTSLSDSDFFRTKPTAPEHFRNRRQLPPPCSFSYRPTCICWNYTTYADLTCYISNTSSYEAVKDSFSRTTIANHSRIDFMLQTADPVPMPTNIYGDKHVSMTTFRCPNKSVVLANITAGAFDPNDKWTGTFMLFECDLTKFSFDFLKTFSALRTLYIYGASLANNIAPDMPPMPSITNVEIYSSDGFRQWYTPSLTPNVNSLSVGWMGGSSDDVMQQLFASIEVYYGQLTRLTLEVDSLTRVPSFIPKLTNLNLLDMWGNDFITLPKGSLTINSKALRFLTLRNMPVQKIEPGAFQGDFSSVTIDFNYNEMTSFPSDVFKDLLTSMVNNGGSVVFTNNPVACDCNLAWLIDGNPHLLPYVDGQLGNGTSFNQLDRSFFANCSSSAL